MLRSSLCFFTYCRYHHTRWHLTCMQCKVEVGIVILDLLHEHPEGILDVVQRQTVYSCACTMINFFGQWLYASIYMVGDI